MTLVPLGPLTNIALAILKDPSIVPLVKEVVIMGGSITEGNVTAAAEANIYNDPEAAQVVFDAGWKLTMVGLDVTHRTVFGGRPLERLAKTHGTLNDFATRVMRFLVELSAKFGAEGTPMHDPLAMGVAIDPSFVRTRHMRVDVETRGQFTRGPPWATAMRRRAQRAPGRSLRDDGHRPRRAQRLGGGGGRRRPFHEVLHPAAGGQVTSESHPPRGAQKASLAGRRPLRGGQHEAKLAPLRWASLLAPATMPAGKLSRADRFGGSSTTRPRRFLPGATAALTNPTTGFTRTTTTNESGAYQFPQIPRGTYDMVLEFCAASRPRR